MTLQFEVDILSAGISPLRNPFADPGAMPSEKNNWPIIVEGPPTLIPRIAISNVRASLAAIISLPFERLMIHPSLLMIVQPVGNT